MPYILSHTNEVFSVAVKVLHSCNRNYTNLSEIQEKSWFSQTNFNGDSFIHLSRCFTLSFIILISWNIFQYSYRTAVFGVQPKSIIFLHWLCVFFVFFPPFLKTCIFTFWSHFINMWTSLNKALCLSSHQRILAIFYSFVFLADKSIFPWCETSFEL